MGQDVNEILANAKKTLADAQSKFPSPVPSSSKPSYTQAHEARNAPSLGDELKAKGEMVQKGKKALEN